jgi:hypothetical protein
LIFKDDFESGNLSAWSGSSTDNGDLSASLGAAYQGSYGLQALVNDTNKLSVWDDSPADETHYRVRFYFNPNSLTMISGNYHHIFDAQDMVTIAKALRLRLYSNASGYNLGAVAADDAGVDVSSAYVTITDGWHVVEVEWQASSAPGANNGFLNLWIDGVLVRTINNIDNDTRTVGRVYLGAPASLDTGTAGTMLFDNFESRRSTYIGP